MATAVRPVPTSTDTGDGWLPLVAPLPSWPWLSSPQHFTEPSSRMAHVFRLPVATATAVRPVPRSTKTGEGWLPVIAPLPSCPYWSSPQHFRDPSSRMAQVWALPVATAIAVRSVPRSTKTGSCWFAVMAAPLPNCPVWSRPQHVSEPLSRTAQVWSAPTSRATAVRPVPRSTVVDGGEVLSVTPAPLPSSPYESSPQHFTEPSSRSAHVCALCTATASAVRPVPRPIDTGELLSATVPSPTCPQVFLPQHLSDPSPRTAQPKWLPNVTESAVSPVPRSTQVGVWRFELTPPFPSAP